MRLCTGGPKTQDWEAKAKTRTPRFQSENDSGRNGKIQGRSSDPEAVERSTARLTTLL